MKNEHELMLEGLFIAVSLVLVTSLFIFTLALFI